MDCNTTAKRLPLINENEVRRTLRLLLPARQVTELRALEATSAADRWPHTASGYFDDPDKLVAALKTIKCAKGIYIIPNPVDPALLARAANRIRKAPKGESTADNNIECRNWLLIDCDPHRPSGVSATDAEHEAALERCRRIFKVLRGAGWPDPIVADSGNGGHLLYCIDLPTDDGGLVQRWLAALAAQFDDDQVKIDQTVFNPARIWKLYGTLACKGDSTPDRPHRMSRIISAPGEELSENGFPADELLLVDEEQLISLAAEAPSGAPQEPRTKYTGQSFDIDAFIARNGLEVDGPDPWQGGRKWTFRTSPMCDHHDDGPYLIQHASGALVAKCHHNSCEWGWHELRAKFEPEKGTENLPEQNGEAREQARSKAGDKEERKSQSTMLVELAAGVDLFHDAGGDAYARFPVGDGDVLHWEVSRIGARPFRRWLKHRFYISAGKAPSAQSLQDALGVIEAKAIYDGDVRKVFIRLAEHEDRIYLDLANDRWQAIEIDRAGWRVVNDPPVMFRRAKAMLPLPLPDADGHIDQLRSFANVTDQDWPLIVAWMVASMRPTGPYPVMAIHGEHGSAKSTLARLLRSPIDPNTSPLRADYREPRDLMICANSGWVVALDNLSDIKPWLSDCFCRLATGGGFSTRTLYENEEETIFDAQRPLILNCIEEVVTRSDLLDRCVLVNLPRIDGDKRKSEAQLHREFEAARPGILGGLLTAVSSALRNQSAVKLSPLPRMADFAIWATAAEGALGLRAGEFIEAYTASRAAGNETAIEASPVGKVLIDFIQERGSWIGTATELLKELESVVSEQTRKMKSWPQTARSLGGHVKRLAANLRDAGVAVEFERTGHKRTRTIALTWKTEQTGNSSSASSASSAPPKTPESAGSSADGKADAKSDADANSSAPSSAQNDVFPEENCNADATDNADAKIPLCSIPVPVVEFVDV